MLLFKHIILGGIFMKLIKSNADTDILMKKYNSIKEQYIEEGYIEYKHLLNSLDSGFSSFIYGLPVFIIYISVFIFFTETIPFFSTKIFIITLIVIYISTPIHEIIHGIGWCLTDFSRFDSIYIFLPIGLSDAYCHCSEPLNTKSYVLGTIMPFIVLSFFPSILSCIFSSPLLLYIAIVNGFGSGSDLSNTLHALKRKDDIILDYPTDCGFTSYKKTIQ